MMTRTALRFALPWSLLGVAGCLRTIELADGSSEGTGSTDPSAGPSTDPSAASTGASATADGTSTDPTPFDVLPQTDCTAEDPCALDILVVVDNSADTPDAQAALVRSLVPLVRTLEGPLATPVDVQIMFTTSDVGSPVCEMFEVVGYDPAMGAPTENGCNARIDWFTSLGFNPEVRPDVCTASCPVDVVPDDPFVAFYADERDNVPDVEPVDIDGDAVPDSAAAQAVACLAPQGINGCGYESPLAAMHLALDPTAAWNTGERPFLRPNSAVTIVLVTTEADCSMDDPSVLEDPQYQEANPNGDMKQTSGAVCWNAGVDCGEPDAEGVYAECVASDGPLSPLSRYTDRLVGELVELEGRQVSMVALTGVPSVTSTSTDVPFEPSAGGEAALVFRDWRDGVHPEGDRLPRDVEDGTPVDELAWEYKIGPGCAQVDGAREIRGIPNPRIHEVCHALDVTPTDGDRGVRCCVESICDATLGLDCVAGMLGGGAGD